MVYMKKKDIKSYLKPKNKIHNSVAFFGGLFSSEFLWFKGLCAIAALLAFMDIKRKINKYKVAL
ncbi:MULTISPECIES: hypothetical protein [unclassified Bacillus (in: firmicutes)]|uniref:hypothetical protein n=1 Tax=Bacillus TaxID=1386 RepID=UPI0026C9A310|nr:hypothetical protein [Bacillus sp. AFS094611]MDC7973183.1 hypothetical protein [Bacillus sp. BLCC-B18]